MSHTAVKSRQINSKHYGSSHISLALSGNTDLTEHNEVSYVVVVKINSKEKKNIQNIETRITCDTMFSSITE